MEAKKGTTTVGITGKDFVILAADKMASMGGLVADPSTQKVFKISNNIAITTAGSVGDLQVLTRFLKAKISRMRIEDGEEPSPKRVATYLGTLLNANKYFPYWVQLVIGGCVEEPYLASIDMIGGVTDTEPIVATGSGSPVAYGALEANYREDLNEGEGIMLAIRAVEAARIRNTYTGGREPGIDVAVISKEGVRMLSPEEVLAIKKSLK